MTKRIVYKNDDGVAIIAPAPKWEGTIEELAKKDVPTGKKYKIVDTSSISSDRTFRNAWEVDEDLLTDGVGE
jgi:hypothetical protein|tara:strand:+ start:759 stop:974 length:216 start_codon:yes stop_codon:yes gene_type:complete